MNLFNKNAYMYIYIHVYEGLSAKHVQWPITNNICWLCVLEQDLKIQDFQDHRSTVSNSLNSINFRAPTIQKRVLSLLSIHSVPRCVSPWHSKTINVDSLCPYGKMIGFLKRNAAGGCFKRPSTTNRPAATTGLICSELVRATWQSCFRDAISAP